MTEAQKWSQERNRLLGRIIDIHTQVRGWRNTFAYEIGARYIEAERHIRLLIKELECFDSYSKVEEMRQEKGAI